jgi:hypothetical protein
VTEAGGHGDLLVNTVGPYCGTLVCGRQGPLWGFEISATAAWRLSFVTWDDLPGWSGVAQGTYPDVLKLPEPAHDLVRASITYRGDGHLAVRAHGATQRVLLNHVGPYRGQVRIPPGTQYVTVETIGAWKASLD